MKISCQSCQAKYTIADEKVAGKTVKIKCKKCGAAIVVQGDSTPSYDMPPAQHADGGGEEAETRILGQDGDPGAMPSASDEWLVNVAEGDERTMTTAQLAEEYARGALSNDTYVWRDGMSDWLPIADVPELQMHTQQPAQAAAYRAQDYADPAPGYAPPAQAYAAPAQGPEDPAVGLMGTFIMDSAAHAASAMAAPNPISSPPAAAIPKPISTPPPAQQGAPTAARRAGGRGAGVDLFGPERASQPAAAAPPPVDRRIGERNENSVLFSLAALTATENAVAKETKKETAPHARPSSKDNGRTGLDDIMNLGGGGLAAPILAPPPLLAPVVEAPPPPPVAAPAVAQMQTPILIPEMPQKKSPVGLVLAIGLSVAAIVGVVLFFTQKPAEDASTTTESTTTTATAAPTPTATETTTAANTAPTAQPDTTAEPATTNTTAAQANTGGKTPPSSGQTQGVSTKPTDTGKTAETAKPAETAAPAATSTAVSQAAGTQPFNQGAALSAVGSAAGAAKGCKKPDGPTGSAKVRITFAPSGRVTSSTVTNPPFAGTPVGGCIASAFRGISVPPFAGDPVSVSKTVTIN